ncbi:hypothetical protein [Streptomyces sioyaensis]|uniref:hypothetical protein n=1 Tax=Streptomyces sioyaensis TaxID=67364 RepID=UPI003D72CEB3
MGRKSQVRRAAKNKQPKDRSWRDAPASSAPFPLVRREKTEVIKGRIYPPTTRVKIPDSGDTVEFDTIAALCGIAEGRITGHHARYLAALAAGAEEAAGIRSRDEMDLDEYIDSHTRLMQIGFIGYDEHGGYLTTPAELATVRG